MSGIIGSGGSVGSGDESGKNEIVKEKKKGKIIKRLNRKSEGGKMGKVANVRM